MSDHVNGASSRLRHWLAVLVVGALSACGSPSSNGTATAPAEAPPPAATPGTPAEPATPGPAPEAAAPQASSVQESSDAGGGEQLKLASAAAPAADPAWRFKEGEDFKVLTTAQGTAGPPGKIEVVEAFWYGCPHCYQFDPIIQEWARKLPADVNFVRLPVTWNPTNQIHARIFYTAQALGKLDEMHSAIFRAIHVDKETLTTEKEIQDLFAKFGVGADDFNKTFRSFAVESQLNRAKDLTARYEVRSVPLLIVDGKFNTDAPGIKNYDEMLAVASELIERERRR